MADMLATPADLASFLQRSDLDLSTATLMLECATAVVQTITGQRIVQVVGDVAVLDLDEYDGGPYLTLPERPVTAVTSATVGATAVTDYTAQMSRGRLWRAMGWRSTALLYGDQPSTATITYTHGYPAASQGVQLARSAVIALAGGAYDNPAGGVASEKIDDYQVAYEAMTSRMEAAPFLSDALRRKYGRPVGSVRLITAGRHQ